jgi:hypothetical protein
MDIVDNWALVEAKLPALVATSQFAGLFMCPKLTQPVGCSRLRTGYNGCVR